MRPEDAASHKVLRDADAAGPGHLTLRTTARVELVSQRLLIWDKGHWEPWITPHGDHRCSFYFSLRILAKSYPENNQSQGPDLAFEWRHREPVP